jgi:LmbE family N-acetylglucosaminyl deacetylase
MTAVVVSPHFDDAVVSCGHWIERHPGTIVATVCTGRPGVGVPADPEWDALANFSSGDDAAASRRDEDRDALAVLGARQVPLGFLDGAYKELVGRCHERPDRSRSFDQELAAAIAGLLEDVRPQVCLIPLGLLHPDHIATRTAALTALMDRPAIEPLVYLDLPYGIAFREAAAEEMETMAASGLPLIESVEPGPPSSSLKRRAASSYRSQLPLLEVNFGAALQESLGPDAERLFRISPGS